ncbi:MAG: hypothetical protein AAF702_29100 [Chloroflexota bacterium]
MLTSPIAGPIDYLILNTETNIPFYIAPFTQQGISEAHQTLERLMNDVSSNRFSDIFIFSHGWNTDWSAAVRGYKAFQENFANMRDVHGMPDHYRPLMIGVFWPSIDFVSGEAQVGPEFAGAEQDDPILDESQPNAPFAPVDPIADLTSPLSNAQSEFFRELIQKDQLNEEEAV